MKVLVAMATQCYLVKTAIRRKDMPKNSLSEKNIERQCKRYAENLGWLSLKLVCPGSIGVPDRMFIAPDGDIQFVEFKTDVGKLSAAQMRMLGIFKEHGHEVQVIRDLHGFKMWVMEE